MITLAGASVTAYGFSLVILVRIGRFAGCSIMNRFTTNMKTYNDIILPVEVSLTHDKEVPVVFAYTGGHGRIPMRAKRFPPRTLGGVEKAIALAAAWRIEALKEHQRLK